MDYFRHRAAESGRPGLRISLILPATGIAAAGSFVGKCRRYKMACWAAMLVAFGVAALFGLSALGGVGV